MRKLLFIDRDGTIVIEPPITKQLDSIEKLEFCPGAITGLAEIAKNTDYELVMVTNQDGLGTGSFPEETFWPVQNLILHILAGEGIKFSEILIDKSFEHQNLPTRKPGTGLLQKYLDGNYDLENSFVIGDRLTDVELAKNLGCKSIFFNNNKAPEADYTTTSWHEINSFLQSYTRRATVSRVTSETEISADVNLEGTGKYTIQTGLGFFDHMLEQVARHGNVDLNIFVKGDLHIDEHHTIEDTAIVLGEAFLKALGNKKGIERYGFLLPMDDCLAQVAIDFGGRPWLNWDVAFRREKIGDMPTEMFYHFFKSFSDSAKCNLDIKAEGNNEHHKIEAIFKAFAKAVKMAVTKNKGNLLPSTKGML